MLPDEELAEAVGLDVGVREDHGALAEINPLADLLVVEMQDAATSVYVESADRVGKRFATSDRPAIEVAPGNWNLDLVFT